MVTIYPHINLTTSNPPPSLKKKVLLQLKVQKPPTKLLQSSVPAFREPQGALNQNSISIKMPVKFKFFLQGNLHALIQRMLHTLVL